MGTSTQSRHACHDACMVDIVLHPTPSTTPSATNASRQSGKKAGLFYSQISFRKIPSFFLSLFEMTRNYREAPFSRVTTEISTYSYDYICIFGRKVPQDSETYQRPDKTLGIAETVLPSATHVCNQQLTTLLSTPTTIQRFNASRRVNVRTENHNVGHARARAGISNKPK